MEQSLYPPAPEKQNQQWERVEAKTGKLLAPTVVCFFFAESRKSAKINLFLPPLLFIVG